MKKTDILIIGGGIMGGICAYELAKYNLKISLWEKNPVFADETSKGNSGAIHGGFDPEPHKIEAKLNVLGNKLWKSKIFKYLGFPRAKVDSLVIAFNDEEMQHIKMLYDRGLQNKVDQKDLKILTAEQVLKKEPLINPEIKGALLCTSSWAIDPVRATYAFLGCAEQNGVCLENNTEVISIKFINNIFYVKAANGKEIKAKVIINVAGHYADIIAQMAGYNDFKLTTRRGEYRILSRTEATKVHNINFMVPTIHGKGVIVAPMLDGRVLVGPTAEEGVPKEDTRLVTKEKFDYIGDIGHKIMPKLDLSRTEMTLAGSRPIDIETNDFVIRSAKLNKQFINCAGMQSPAIASAPAIALEVVKLVKKTNLNLIKKVNYNPKYSVRF